ncbi:hypothetical protein [Geobacter grbiciae]|uniref:hypothetical protein n=1 Tax=Geobacter grbiciae TaxID=155042 RepID=UPI001C027BA7|nr:hypothetical protein [Geobacter grbiciae]MBT1075162.1 hypothetical protein [Geobacter grbiciae]
MITILFISDDTRVPDLIARVQSQLKARMRLATDFDQGLKEVFDNRPSAVFIQGDISGISGETVARHIKTLLRGDAPRIVLIHTAPLPTQGVKKWFDDAVDFSLPQAELADQFKLRLMEIAPDLRIETNDVPTRHAGNVAAAPNVSDHPAPSPGEVEPFDWEAPGDAVPHAVQPPCQQAHSEVEGRDESDSLPDISQVLVGRGAATTGPGMPSPGSELRNVMPSIIEESATTQSTFSEQIPSTPATPSPSLTPQREAEPKPAPLRQPSPLQAVESSRERTAASMADFSAEMTKEAKAAWVTIPPPDRELEGATGQRLTVWAVAIVVLLLGAMVGGALLLKGEGNKNKSSPKPEAMQTAPTRTSPAPAPPAKAIPLKTAPAALPSFIPASGKDEGFGKVHPGWERYLGKGTEYRLFRENGRLKAVQVIALRGTAVPETLVVAVVRELTGSERLGAVSSQTKKGGYLRQVGKVDGKGEVVIYRKGGGVRGVVVTLN